MMRPDLGKMMKSYSTLPGGGRSASDGGIAEMSLRMRPLWKSIEDAKRAAEDPVYCDELMKQYGIG